MRSAIEGRQCLSCSLVRFAYSGRSGRHPPFVSRVGTHVHGCRPPGRGIRSHFGSRLQDRGSNRKYCNVSGHPNRSNQCCDVSANASTPHNCIMSKSPMPGVTGTAATHSSRGAQLRGNAIRVDARVPHSSGCSSYSSCTTGEPHSALSATGSSTFVVSCRRGYSCKTYNAGSDTSCSVPNSNINWVLSWRSRQCVSPWSPCSALPPR